MVKELNQLGVPVTVACRRLGISRSTYYYRSRDKSTNLKEAIMEIAYMYPSFGYRRITAALRNRGFKVNHKKVYRLYRELNLQKSVKRRGYRKKVSYQQPPVAEHPNHVWSMDIIEDRTEGGKKIRIFNVIDVYSRYAFTPLVDSSITGEKAAIHFEELILRHGAPKVIIRDDGSEFRSKEFGRVVRKYRIEEVVIPPGEPFKNGYVESFHSRLREELLSAELFENLEDARRKIIEWIEWYNSERPHSSLDYLSPSEVFYAEGSLYF
jgi:putative transposase